MKRDRRDGKLDTTPIDNSKSNKELRTLHSPCDFLTSIPHPIPANIEKQFICNSDNVKVINGEIPPTCMVGVKGVPSMMLDPMRNKHRNKQTQYSSSLTKLGNENPVSHSSMIENQYTQLMQNSDTTKSHESETKRIWPAMGFGKMDIREKEDCYLVCLDIPGVSKESIDISLRPTSIVVECTRKPIPLCSGKFRYIERPVGKLIRTIQLPSKANAEAITSSYLDGVLTITIGKSNKPSTIQKIHIQYTFLFKKCVNRELNPDLYLGRVES